MIEVTNYHKIDQNDSNVGVNGNERSSNYGWTPSSTPLGVESSSSAVPLSSSLPVGTRQDPMNNGEDVEPSSPQMDDASFGPNTTLIEEETLHRRWAVALFSVTTVLLFADQNLMSPNLTAMAHDFGFDDTQRDQKLGGDIALAFFVLGAPASFVVGALGDTYNRTRLFAITVWVGEGACLGTYFAQTYHQLYACRAITGFALGGALPLIYSILGDLYAAHDRHWVNALVGIGTGMGISVGQGVAGFLGPTWGWRLPFLVISIPALICAALVSLTVQDPERGGMEEAVVRHHHQQPYRTTDTPVEMVPLHETTEQQRSSRCGDALAAPPVETKNDEEMPGLSVYCETFATLLSTPTVVLSLLQGAPGCVPWGICVRPTRYCLPST